MKIRRLLLIVGLLLMMVVASNPVTAQGNNPVTMTVEAGFNNFYRPGYWLPLQIQISNDGTGFSGRLVVRPETSGRSVASAFSTPIDLPNGSEKTVFLYIQAQPNASTVILELLDDEGVRVTDQVVGLTSIAANDALYVSVSGTGAASIPLNTVAQTGFTARQARWTVDNVPDDVALLHAIDTMFLYDVASDAFTPEQLSAIESWVTMGGHLIVVGGPSWQQTTANLSEALLPFSPDGSENVENIDALATYINRTDSLEALTFLTTGTVAEDADIRIETEDGLPLLVRRELGLGITDFLTVDPTLEPLRSWDGLRDFWYMLVSDLPPEPGWQRGLLELQDAARAIAILPNVNLLPSANSMILFITAYILLIGPINYFVLSRMRRRAWAWATIPLLIVAFTLLAWNVGFNLRGNELIVSRVYVVQSFPNSDLAHQDQLVGVLSPSRDTYTVNAPDNTVMGFLPGVEDDSLFSANVTRTTSEIVQGQTFTVPDIAIDGGIFANFHLTSIVDAPDISGSATIGYITGNRDEDADITDPTPQSLRGVVRNDSDITLHDVVIITRNRFYRVDGEFAPGDIINFDEADFEPIILNDDSVIPVAAPIESAAVNDISEDINIRSDISDSLVTSRVLLNINWSAGLNRLPQEFEENFDEEHLRRRAFLRAFMRDQNDNRGIGNQVYVMGWTNEVRPTDITVTDTEYRSVDTTLHIIELDTEIELPSSTESITLHGDQFTWAMTDVELGQVFGNLGSLTMVSPSFAEFQIVPIEGAILDEVDTLIIEINRGTSLGREVRLSLWNFDTQTWDLFDERRLEQYIVETPAPYLGRDNMVNIRFEIDTDIPASNNNGRVVQTRVIQVGRF